MLNGRTCCTVAASQAPLPTCLPKQAKACWTWIEAEQLECRTLASKAPSMPATAGPFPPRNTSTPRPRPRPRPKLHQQPRDLPQPFVAGSLGPWKLHVLATTGVRCDKHAALDRRCALVLVVTLTSPAHEHFYDKYRRQQLLSHHPNNRRLE
ncbi:uncharacterized protein PG986_006140 [Apiospora aurea]|uniref:Uncharacterized protein n=1 Tax=Apiospora aurea TaxID=335848 RepID=A0ABR1QJK0_9PEZI